MDILKTSGSPDLFSPELESERRKQRDPVTTDLLGALLAVMYVLVLGCTLLNVVFLLW